VTTDDKSDSPDLPDPEVVEAETTAVEETAAPEAAPKRRFSLTAAVAFGLLPILALLLAAAAGYLKWEDSSRRDADRARTESVQVAKDSTVALLTYKPDTVEKDLGAARDRLTGNFLDAYTQLVNSVVIPGAKEKKISALAQVPAAASVSAKPDHAVVLLFVNQTVVVGTDAPTNTASSVRVTLDKVGDRWLISGFDPI
jgi:Mce-associated membrane protein